MTKVVFKKLREDAIIPSYAHGMDEDAGMDLYAVEEAWLYPHKPVLVKTGIAIEMPPGLEGQIRSRSGLALKYGIYVLNAPGTVDPSYRGELGVILCWTGHNGKIAGHISKGDRIAQIVFSRYEGVSMVEGELGESDRGEGGFGSTGQ